MGFKPLTSCEEDANERLRHCKGAFLVHSACKPAERGKLCHLRGRKRWSAWLEIWILALKHQRSGSSGRMGSNNGAKPRHPELLAYCKGETSESENLLRSKINILIVRGGAIFTGDRLRA